MYEMVNGKIRNPRGCEINAAQHCNLRCRSCSHLSPILPTGFADPEVVERSLTQLSQVYSAMYVKILGGEPLLHPNLPDLLRRIRRSAVADGILLTTNGLLLGSRHPEVWEIVDAIEISIYPGRAISNTQLDEYRERARQHGVLLVPVLITSFRESYSEDGTRDAETIDRIYRTCKIVHEWQCHTIQDGYFYRCPQSYFLHLLPGGLADPRQEGLKIEASEGFMDRLKHFLGSSIGPEACRRCLGTVGKQIPHTQVQRSVWRKPQQGSSESLLDWSFLKVLEHDITADAFGHQYILGEGESIPGDWIP